LTCGGPQGPEGTATSDKVESVVDYIHSVPSLRASQRSTLREILGASNVIKVMKGKVVVVEGEIDDSFYIILSGKASVRKGAQTIAVISRGECFGEMSYLSGQSRAATVLAETDLHPPQDQRHAAGQVL